MLSIVYEEKYSIHRKDCAVDFPISININSAQFPRNKIHFPNENIVFSDGMDNIKRLYLSG